MKPVPESDVPAIAVADYHLHTCLCGHAEGAMAEYVRSAVALGLPEIGFSDHLPLFAQADPELAMAPPQLAGYVDEVLELRRRHPRLCILLGIEVDYVPETEEAVRALLAEHPFDYVIGSVHFIDGFLFDHPRNRAALAELDREALALRYFALVTRAADSGLFDVLAHFDLIRKFGGAPAPDGAAGRQALAALQAAARNGTAVEVNTSGWRHPTGLAYPAPRYLQSMRELGVPLTFGSDAHRPQDVGARFGDAVAAARAAGYDRWLRLSDRVEVPLP